jgi:hypothetical protein
MSQNIIVTTPQRCRSQARKEAENCIKDGGGYYFRKFPPQCRPKHLGVGDRVYYVQDRFLRGFALVDSFEYLEKQICDTSGQDFGAGYFVYMNATTWQWVKPSLFKGFQGWRYALDWVDLLPIVGGWLDPMPSGGVPKS